MQKAELYTGTGTLLKTGTSRRTSPRTMNPAFCPSAIEHHLQDDGCADTLLDDRFLILA
jgi:hypothetical protein